MYLQFTSVLRRGGGLNRSSSENVRAVEPVGGWGLLRLKIDGFLIPKRPKIDFGCPGVVALGVPVCDEVWRAPPATCSCSRREM